MCGIVGILNIDRDLVDPVTLQQMCELIQHRGPDDKGFFCGPGVGLGVQRLKIIDLLTGHQPIHNEDQSLWIVFNGEIYNFLFWRSELETKGHKFYTRTDTEVILHLYEEYGEGFVEKLNGMFGIAIWDENKRKLILARDRIGIKPLYYYIDDHKLIFCLGNQSYSPDSLYPKRC